MTLLETLVTSTARRRVLVALWKDGVEASVSELARSCRLSFSAAHTELVAMRAAGLASCRRTGTRSVYAANDGSPHAVALRTLLADPAADDDAGARDRVRTWLADHGAPLMVSGRDPGEAPPPLEVVVAEALVLAHRDSTVARVLPVLFWLNRDRLDWARLETEATARDERHALGFFLELTGELAHDPNLGKRAQHLLDHRRRRQQHFFSGHHGPYALAAAKENSPPFAQRWGYFMNMPLDGFASAFAKHVS